MRATGLIFLLYIVIGVIVAATQGYFSGVGNISGLLEAVVAVLIWPLILIGVDFDFSGGGGGS